MPNLYIITGPAGVGKSTVSKKIAMTSKKSALIEGDDIYHQVVGGYVPAWKEKKKLPVQRVVLTSPIRACYWHGLKSLF